MTREEYQNAINNLWSSNYNFNEECKKSIDIKVEYISSLEQQIKELEEHTDCSGCKHYFIDMDREGCKLYEQSIDIMCSRQFVPDYYDAKE